ncbi:MAG: hypothetical protein HZR80_03635 [Candidatus Heimdallarchaeota archaeon]
MKERGKIIELFSVLVILTLLFGYPTYFFISNNSEDIKHETNRWAIIKDYDGNQLAVDASNRSIWEEIRKDYETNPGSPMFIYGMVVSYDNSWQFRLEPSTVISFIGNIKGPSYTIIEIANNLELHLSKWRAIRIKSIRFFNFKYAGIIGLTFDMTLSIISIILFSLYLFSKRKRRIYEKIKEALLVAKETPEGISFTLLSQKVDLKQKRIEQLINKRNLKEDLGLQITDDRIQFKDLIYSKSICQIEEQLNNFLQLSPNHLTLEHYSKLFQFKNDLDEALLYFTKDSSNVEKQNQIETKIEVITNLLESITLDAII